MSIKILLADDHRIIREGLKALIGKEPDMEVVAAAVNGREAVRLAHEFSPDVVIMDISMPDLNGIEATRKILAEKPGIKVIALSMHSDKRFVAKMLQAGVTGYLLKDCAFDELVQAKRTVLNNRIYLSPAIDNLVVNDYINQLSQRDLSLLANLGPREREVLQLIAEGLSTKKIAFRLGLSGKTIETYRRHIMRKLNAENIADLVKVAIKEGLTSIET